MTHTPIPLPEQRDLIAGNFTPPSEALPQWVCDSNSGERLTQQVQSSDASVLRAVDAASESHRAGLVHERGALGLRPAFAASP